MEWNGNRISKFRGKKLRENEMCRFGHDFLRSRNDRLDKDNNTEIEIVNFLLFSPSIKILEDRDPRRFYLFVAERFRPSDAYHRSAEKHFFFLHCSSRRILLHDQTRISGIK